MNCCKRIHAVSENWQRIREYSCFSLPSTRFPQNNVIHCCLHLSILRQLVSQAPNGIHRLVRVFVLHRIPLNPPASTDRLVDSPGLLEPGNCQLGGEVFVRVLSRILAGNPPSTDKHCPEVKPSNQESQSSCQQSFKSQIEITHIKSP